MKSNVTKLALLSFLRFAALGWALPFLNLYLTDIGLTATTIGILISVGALIELLLTPLMNTFADRRGLHRALYVLYSIALAIATFSLTIFAAPILVVSAYLLHGITARPSISLLSQLTITKLDVYRLNIFGRIRALGSIGWASTTMFSGAIFALGGYPLLFFLSGLVNLASLPFISVLPKQTSEKPDKESPPEPRQMGFYILLASQFVFHVGMNAAFAFLYIHMAENLSATPEDIGVIAALIALFEVIPMLLVDSIIKRSQIRAIMIIGMIGMSFAWLMYGLVPTLGWMVVLVLLRGTFYTFWIVSITLMVARISAPVNVATNQALVQVTMPALAMLLTSPIAGWIFDTYGASTMYAFAMTMGLCGSVILVLSYRKLKPRNTKKVVLPEEQLIRVR